MPKPKADERAVAKPKEEEYGIEIRSSSLGGFAKCIRHAAANRERELVVVAHPDVGTKEKSGGYRTYAGTVFHKCMEENVKAASKIKKITNEIMLEPSESSDFFDDKFSSVDQLADIIQAMVNSFRKSAHSSEWTMKRHGNKFEQALRSREIDKDIILSGHIDCIRKDGLVLDLKTGVTNDMNLYQEQLTAYRMLTEHAGMKALPHAEVVKVARPKTPKFRVPPTSVRYRIDTRQHETRVISLVKKAADIVAYRDRWIEDFTKLPANPASSACAYCELRNTSACPETQRLEV